MNKRNFCFTSLLIIISAAASFADWRINLTDILNDGFENLVEADARSMAVNQDKIESIAKTIPAAEFLLREIKKREYKQPQSKGKLQSFKMTGQDGVERPWLLYTPDSYWSKRATPLIIALHGAVSRKEITDDPEG